eukprot:2261432-Prymnesium_polylepis.2
MLEAEGRRCMAELTLPAMLDADGWLVTPPALPTTVDADGRRCITPLPAADGRRCIAEGATDWAACVSLIASYCAFPRTDAREPSH